MKIATTQTSRWGPLKWDHGMMASGYSLYQAEKQPFPPKCEWERPVHSLNAGAQSLSSNYGSPFLSFPFFCLYARPGLSLVEMEAESHPPQGFTYCKATYKKTKPRSAFCGWQVQCGHYQSLHGSVPTLVLGVYGGGRAVLTSECTSLVQY